MTTLRRHYWYFSHWKQWSYLKVGWSDSIVLNENRITSSIVVAVLTLTLGVNELKSARCNGNPVCAWATIKANDQTRKECGMNLERGQWEFKGIYWKITEMCNSVWSFVRFWRESVPSLSGCDVTFFSYCERCELWRQCLKRWTRLIALLVTLKWRHWVKITLN